MVKRTHSQTCYVSTNVDRSRPIISHILIAAQKQKMQPGSVFKPKHWPLIVYRYSYNVIQNIFATNAVVQLAHTLYMIHYAIRCLSV